MLYVFIKENWDGSEVYAITSNAERADRLEDYFNRHFLGEIIRIDYNVYDIEDLNSRILDDCYKTYQVAIDTQSHDISVVQESCFDKGLGFENCTWDNGTRVVGYVIATSAEHAKIKFKNLYDKQCPR